MYEKEYNITVEDIHKRSRDTKNNNNIMDNMQ
jgi:hypothetical protein